MKLSQFLHSLVKYKWEVILGFTLFPLVINSFFNLPVGDDFIFGHIGKNNSVLDSVLFWYNGWGGRYTQELFLTIFNPLSFNCQNLFWLPPIILIAGILFSLLFVIRTVGGKSLTSRDTLILLTVISFLVLNLMPEIGEVLYWISGAYTFQTGNIFFIILVAVGFKISQKLPLWKLLLLLLVASILIVLISGSNEVSMAYTFGFSLLFLIYNFYKNPKRILISLFLIAISCVGAYFSISAPGNFVRAAHTGGMMQNIPKNLLESSVRGFFYLMFWLPSSILLTLIIWKQIGVLSHNFPQKKVTDKQVISTFILLVLVVFAGFFPSLASTGWNPPRTVAPIFITFILFFFGICIYYYDYFNFKLTKFNLSKNNISVYIVILLFVGFSNRHNIMNSYVDLFSLKTYKYNVEVKETYKKLSSKNNDTVYILPLNARPLTFPIRWPDNYNKLVNGEMKEYFQKEVLMQPN